MDKSSAGNNYALKILCDTVRENVKKGEYEECELLISEAMSKYPHAPEPHNLLGILLEKNNDHLSAMKHFRAAWALDPTYIPARVNMEHYGSLFSKWQCAYDEADCKREFEKDLYKMVYDEDGIGKLVLRKKKELL